MKKQEMETREYYNIILLLEATITATRPDAAMVERIRANLIEEWYKASPGLSKGDEEKGNTRYCGK